MEGALDFAVYACGQRNIAYDSEELVFFRQVVDQVVESGIEERLAARYVDQGRRQLFECNEPLVDAFLRYFGKHLGKVELCAHGTVSACVVAAERRPEKNVEAVAKKATVVRLQKELHPGGDKALHATQVHCDSSVTRTSRGVSPLIGRLQRL